LKSSSVSGILLLSKCARLVSSASLNVQLEGPLSNNGSSSSNNLGIIDSSVGDLDLLEFVSFLNGLNSTSLS